MELTLRENVLSQTVRNVGIFFPTFEKLRDGLFPKKSDILAMKSSRSTVLWAIHPYGEIDQMSV
jgi:hypothetical protein